ncbi:hypothetical protein ACFZA9_12035 [Streptomyces olivaceus]|uniref:hypothetical protein n=1 Tax=Streptomyces olivaceus TaxID=47716 RepID=UPI0036EBB8A8
MTDRRRLSTVDLLTWAVVLGYRDQQQRAGIRILLLPLPPCPACNARVLDGTASWVRDIGREEVTISMRPCGHNHWVPLRAVEELQDHVVAMLGGLEYRMLTTAEIAREAHARLDQDATGPEQCPPGVHSIFDPCPGDCGKPVDDEPPTDRIPLDDLTSDQLDALYDQLAAAEAALVRVHHLAAAIHAGAPWLSNHSETAARIRAAIAGPTTTED